MDLFGHQTQNIRCPSCGVPVRTSQLKYRRLQLKYTNDEAMFKRSISDVFTGVRYCCIRMHISVNEYDPVCYDVNTSPTNHNIMDLMTDR